MNATDDLATLARVTVSLLVVVTLAVVGARLARRAGVRGGGAGLRVLERTGLSREASVAVVEVGGRGIVVGVTAQGVTLLTELTAGELVAARAAGEDPGPGSGGRARRVAVRGGPLGRRPLGTSLDGTPPYGTPPEHPPEPGTAATTRAARGTGSVLDPRTWRQAVDALRDLTARRP